MATLLLLSPFFFTNLCLQWLLRVFATAASEEGFGVVETAATQEELDREAKWGQMTGWPIGDLTKIYGLGEEEFWVPDSAPGELQQLDIMRARG